MKKQIINEINRTREIMGLGSLLLTEQASLLKFFMSSFAKSKNVWTSLNKTILHQFSRASGAVPIARIAKLDGMVDIISTVMENTISRYRHNGQYMSQKFFGAGIDVTEEQAARLGRAWTDGEASFAVTLKNMSGGVIDDLKAILIKPGKEASGLQKPMIEAITSAINPKTTDEFKILLKEAGMPSAKVDEIMEMVNMYGHVGSGKNLEDVFGVLIDSPSYQKQMIETLKNSSEFQDLVRLDDAFTQHNLAKLMGREADDATVKLIYQSAIKQKWWEWTLAKGKGIVSWLALTTPGRIFLGGVIFTKTWNLICDSIYSVWGKKKAGLTPDMYLDLYTNKLFIQKYGGFTDDQARMIAQKINDSFGGMWPVTWAKDNTIKDEYKKMPSILAASQVAYWFENLDGAEPEIDEEKFLDDKKKVPNPNYLKPIKITSGTLYKQLLKMDVEALPKGITGGVDITIGDVADELDTKSWTTSLGTTSRLKYVTEINDNWPQYQPVLKKDGEKYYSKFKGPIDVPLLGLLLQECPNADGSNLVQEDCLRKFDPIKFNSAWSTLDAKNKIPIYTTTEGEVKDTTEKFFTDFLGDIEEGETKDWLDKAIKMWEDATN